MITNNESILIHCLVLRDFYTRMIKAFLGLILVSTSLIDYLQQPTRKIWISLSSSTLQVQLIHIYYPYTHANSKLIKHTCPYHKRNKK